MIAAKNGRLLWIDGETVDRLRDSEGGASLPEAEEIDVWALEAILGHYHKAEGNPAPYLAKLRERPFPRRPRRLLNTMLWEKKSQSDYLFVRKKSRGCFPLSDFTVAKGSSVVILESPIASAADVDIAWKWEEANRSWVEEWRIEKEKREAAKQTNRRLGQTNQREAEDKLLVEVGKAVLKGLPNLLPAITQLKNKASNDTSEKIRSNQYLPPGLKEWPVKCWTPLANLDVPLAWIFGRDQRLWQIRIYCTHFCHRYAKKYRSRHGIRANGYDSIRTGYALKALARMGLLEEGKEVQSQLDSINREIDRVIAGSRVAKPQWSAYHLIELHAVRHLVVASYFERLCDLSFLKRSYLGRIGNLHSPSSHQVREALKNVCDLYRWAKKNYIPEALLSRLSRQWLKLASSCGAADQNSYEVEVPFHPPYYSEKEQFRLVEAIDRDVLRVWKDGMYTDDGEVITELEWMRKSG
jgi:hypothetical protein